MGAFHMAIYARQSKSRPHYLFTICLIWMALIELKEFFLSHDAAYNYEILGPGFTFPDLFTLAQQFEAVSCRDAAGHHQF
uniref:hypothetical protein n=1 Tax=Alistipes putredinis TaxID=28117 RepID=UPI003FD8E4A6